MPRILLADIGGTNSRLAFLGAHGRPESIMAIVNKTMESPEALIAHALEKSGEQADAAVLAIAGPIDGDEIRLTNRAWCLRLSDLSRRFGLRAITAVNDFEAQAWAVSGFRQDDVRALGPLAPAHQGVKVVLGPGTGLGVGALVPVNDGHRVIATEAGHMSFGPRLPDEDAVFAALRARFGLVSAELVLSGPGLTRLHQALHADTMLPPEDILAGAREGDMRAQATIALFVRLLGRFAGDAALAFKATGGVYIAGGVAFGLGELFDAEIFRAAFEQHAPYESLMARIPTALVTCPEPGLLGCAVLARRLETNA